MVGAYLLNHPQEFLIHPQIHAKFPETDHSINHKEQESISLIKKCKNLEEFKQIHAQILKLGLLWSSFCTSNLLAACALSQWGSMDYACSIFEQIEDPCSFDCNAMIRGYLKDMRVEQALFTYLDMLGIGVEADNFTYPLLLKACALLGESKEGMQIHGQIMKHGFDEDVFVQNGLINMYGNCGLLGDSCSVFERIEKRTVASWSSIISAHAKLGMWGECLELFFCMLHEGQWRAEESVVVSVLSACTHLGTLDWGRSIHGYIVRNLSGMNVAVETALIDMYIRCGSLERGMSLFQEMDNKNHKSYSVAISGLASHGRGEEALALFEKMVLEGLKPDDIVYVGALRACTLVEEGKKLFERMWDEHRIKPTIQHYGCMVDLMGRTGLLNEARDLIKSMPMEPNDVVWRSLLSSCKIHKNVELGEVAVKNLVKLNAKNGGEYAMMCSLYAQGGRWDEVAATRVKMARLGLGRVAGSSAVEVKGKLHRFVSNGVLNREVCEMMHQMEWQLKFEGYKADLSEVLIPVGEEEKQERLRSHSQKAALAFALVSTSEGSVVRIVRNVRMCRDCHTYTKMISVIYEREIVVKDRNVFHCFKDGTCSCKDFW